MDAVDDQLETSPETETRNRKEMRPNPLATWELRVGDLRAYYVVHGTSVFVRAVGRKVRNEVIIGGERYRL